MSMKDDVPLLTEVQFSALHMTLSVQGYDYCLSQDYLLPTLLAEGWCVIARTGDNTRMYGLAKWLLLAAPVAREEDEE